MSHTGYNKEKVEEHKVKIQQILSAFTTTGFPPDGNLDGGAPQLVPVDPRNTATASVSESGTSVVHICRFYMER